MRNYEMTGIWKPKVSLDDGLSAVEIGLQATQAIVNEDQGNSSLNKISGCDESASLPTLRQAGRLPA